MEKTKVCKECQLSLDVSNFSSGRAVCKDCRNKRDRKQYTQLKKTLEQNSERTTIETLVLDLTDSFKNSVQNHERHEDIMKKFADLNKIFAKFLDETEILRFNIKAPDRVKQFLIKCDECHIDQQISVMFLRSNQNHQKFEATFGKTQKQLQDEILDDLEDFFKMMDAVRAVYVYWIDSKRMEFGEKIDRNSFSISYHPMDDIIITSNPFGLSNDEFMRRLDELLVNPPLVIKQFQDWDLYDQFREMIV